MNLNSYSDVCRVSLGWGTKLEGKSVGCNLVLLEVDRNTELLNTHEYFHRMVTREKCGL